MDKTSNIPFLAIGYNELGNPAEFVYCDKCGETHEIEYGESRELLANGQWSEPKRSKKAGFYLCGDKLYLGALDGRLIR